MSLLVLFVQQEQQRLAAEEKAAKEREAAKQREAAAKQAAKTQVNQQRKIICNSHHQEIISDSTRH